MWILVLDLSTNYMQYRKRTYQLLVSTSKRIRLIMSTDVTIDLNKTTRLDHGICLACEELRIPLSNNHGPELYPS